MLISEKIGGLLPLSWLWDHGPIWAAMIVLFADFGIMYALMFLEGISPFRRKQYITVVCNDTFIYPLYAAMAVVILQHSAPLHGFFTSSTWHIGLLTTGFIISIALEIMGVKQGQYTLNQELSPSKLWHTFIFGIMFYWLLSVLIPVIIVHQPLWAMTVVIGCLIVTVTTMYMETVSPWPHDAHLEGSYIPWRWQVRKSNSMTH